MVPDELTVTAPPSAHCQPDPVLTYSLAWVPPTWLPHGATRAVARSVVKPARLRVAGARQIAGSGGEVDVGLQRPAPGGGPLVDPPGSAGDVHAGPALGAGLEASQQGAAARRWGGATAAGLGDRAEVDLTPLAIQESLNSVLAPALRAGLHWSFQARKYVVCGYRCRNAVAHRP